MRNKKNRNRARNEQKAQRRNNIEMSAEGHFKDGKDVWLKAAEETASEIQYRIMPGSDTAAAWLSIMGGQDVDWTDGALVQGPIMTLSEIGELEKSSIKETHLFEVTASCHDGVPNIFPKGLNDSADAFIQNFCGGGGRVFDDNQDKSRAFMNEVADIVEREGTYQSGVLAYHIEIVGGAPLFNGMRIPVSSSAKEVI